MRSQIEAPESGQRPTESQKDQKGDQKDQKTLRDLRDQVRLLTDLAKSLGISLDDA